MTRRVERVVVVGRDAAAWIAALAVRRALGPSGVSVVALELPSLLEDGEAYQGLPSLGGLHKLLGLDEALLFSRCGAVPMVGRRFSNWAGPRPPFLHGFDGADGPGRDLPFLQYWLKARAQGLRVAFEDFSLAAAAAKQGRIPQPGAAPGEPQAQPGYQIDSNQYAGLLKFLARQSGVETRAGRIVGVARGGGGIQSVEFESGETFEADLFIDASGPEALLIKELDDEGLESWSGWLPCDNLLTASGAPLSPLPAFAQISAFRSGWVAVHPLQGRTAVVAAFAGDMTERETLERLPALAGVGIEGDATIRRFAPGARRRSWIGNCVALGEAAVALEPLDAAPLHLVHAAVSHLVALFPVTAAAMPEAQAYNKAMWAQACNARDFQIAHYRLNQRFDEPFWDLARDAAAPESLQAKLAAFETRGQVALYDEEFLDEPDWAALYLGHGSMPSGFDPRVENVPAEEQMAKVQARLHGIAMKVTAMPTVEQHIEAAAAGGSKAW